MFNEEATYEQYLEMYKYGNHKSVEQNLDKVMLTMNKDDQKDHVLTFPAFLAEFIQDLMLTAQGFITMLQGKTIISSLILHSFSAFSPNCSTI